MVNINMFTINKYYKIYFAIIKRAQQRTLDKNIKSEIHHIVPRSLGGGNDQSNLAKLTLKEHWVCHRLLVKMLIDPKHVRKMYNALYMMAVKDYRTVNGRTYQLIKENIVPWNKGITGYKGKPCATETKQTLSEMWKGKPRPEHHKDAMKEGWEKLKNDSYSPWNKGLTGIHRSGKPVIIVSPEGVEYRYDRLKDGCRDLGLTYTYMSSVNSGKKSDWKGWTVKPLNMI
jgi:hypothetical protein